MNAVNKILLFVLMLTGVTSYSQTQKLPVQGKLYDNNMPVNGTRNFMFSIATISWNQSLSNVPITEGLYSVELDVPSDLFGAQNSRDLRIEVNGTLLSTVKIHAPIEKDPTVPANLKDGVSWNEIAGIPATLDDSPTNEIQTLEINGNSLSISDGNTVQLPGGGGGGSIDTLETLVVGPAQLTPVVAAEPPAGGTSQQESVETVTQSFIAGVTGALLSIEVECANFANKPVEFSLKTIGGQVIASNNFPASAFSSSLSYQLFPPSQSGVLLAQYTTYIFEIKVLNGNYLFGYRPNNPYLFGSSSLSGGDKDLNFRVNVEALVGPSFQVDANGKVGIGTPNPTSTLTVNGRIEDQTGFVMPVGSIMAWAGSPSNPPKGWLICDGDNTKSRAVYADLFQVISTSWGDGVDNTTFRLPDLRGNFLRGYSGTSSNDPEKDSRIEIHPGGAKENNVGSFQLDAFQGHRHKVPGSGGAAGTAGFWTGPNTENATIYTQNSVISDGTNGEPRISSESRPRNAAVLYIIKY